jgi:hypothetical protein
MDHLKHIFDAGSTVAATFTIIGWFANVLPPMAALASILWIAFQFYHSAPMTARRRARKEARERTKGDM